MPKRLLWVGWEAADWRILNPLLDAGRLPALGRLVETGVCGTLLSGSPLLPAPQWTSLVTGKRCWQHGICQQVEFDAAAGRPVPIAGAHRQSAALWEMLAQTDQRSILVGWPATHGMQGHHLLMASNRFSEPTAGPGIRPWPPAMPGTYWPESLGARLDALRVSPEAVPADYIAHFVPRWQEVNQKQDRRLGQLRVFLAADLSHFQAAKALLAAEPWEFAAVHFPALGPISALCLPCASPPGGPAAEIPDALFGQAVSAACIRLDQMLAELIRLAGPDTAVVVASAHGVQTPLPPQYQRTLGPDAWKSTQGMLTMSGPGLKRDALLVGATIPDLAPTLLTWFGLPIGDDMEGRVLVESFETAPEIERVPSWDCADTLNPAGAAVPSPLDAPGPAGQIALQATWNRAQSLLEASRFEAARPILDEVFRAFPERADFGLALFQCQLTLKQTDEAALTLEAVVDMLPPGVWPLLSQAELLIAQGKRTEAQKTTEAIRDLQPADPEALRRLGMLWWRLREWSELQRLATDVLARDDSQPLAWVALAEASLRLGKLDPAIEAARRAISLNFFLAHAHLVLGRALLQQGKWSAAQEALQTLLRLQPENRTVATYSRRAGVDRDQREADAPGDPPPH